MTQSHLIVKEEGICIYRVPEKPVFSALQMLSPATNSECVKAIEDWKEAVKQAQSSAILCEDQERAKEIIKSKFGHDLDQMTINTKGYIYPVPGIEFEPVWINPCIPEKRCLNADVETCKQTCKKLYIVARLIEHTAEKESLQDMGYAEQVWQWYAPVINKWVDVTFEEWDHMKSKGKNPKHLRTIFKPIATQKSESHEEEEQEFPWLIETNETLIGATETLFENNGVAEKGICFITKSGDIALTVSELKRLVSEIEAKP